MSTQEQKLDSLNFNEEDGYNSGDDIYQDSLADSQAENIAKEDVPETTVIAVDGADASNFDSNLDAFDRHFRAFYAGQDYGFDFFKPAYRYGFELAMAHEYTGEDWSEQYDNMRTTWQSTNPDTWDAVEDAVKHGWNKAQDVMDAQNT